MRQVNEVHGHRCGPHSKALLTGMWEQENLARTAAQMAQCLLLCVTDRT